MNYYLLSVPNNLPSENLCREIAISLSPIVDTLNLKFHYSQNQILFFFGAEAEKSDIFEYINGILYGVVDIFILTEMVDNYSIYLPNDIREHLFDLDNVGNDVNMVIDMNSIKQNLDFSFDEDDDEDDEYEDFISKIITNKLSTSIPIQPTLDQLLDKLYSEGMDSLSMEEKKILETYSNN